MTRLSFIWLPAILLLLNPLSSGAATFHGAFWTDADGGFTAADTWKSADLGPLTDHRSFDSLFMEYRVDIGEIGVYARNVGMSATGGSFNRILGGVEAGFHDGLTVTAPGVAASSRGVLQARVNVAGQFAAEGNATAVYHVHFDISAPDDIPSGNGLSGGMNGNGDSWNGPGSYVVELPITFGVQMGLSMTAIAAVFVSTLEPGQATVDLLNAVSWGGVLGVLDSTGQPLDSFLIESVSGYDYATLASPVPLPASAWLLLSGMGIVGMRSWRRRAAKTP